MWWRYEKNCEYVTINFYFLSPWNLKNNGWLYLLINRKCNTARYLKYFVNFIKWYSINCYGKYKIVNFLFIYYYVEIIKFKLEKGIAL